MSGALYTDLDEHAQRGLLIISRGTAILLLGVYVAYLFFQLKTHASLFHPKPGEGEALPDESGRTVEEEVEIAKMSVVAAGVR
jgi:Ca2+:H+ antiporter